MKSSGNKDNANPSSKTNTVLVGVTTTTTNAASSQPNEVQMEKHDYDIMNKTKLSCNTNNNNNIDKQFSNTNTNNTNNNNNNIINPYDRGSIISNFANIFCSSIPPSTLNLREVIPSRLEITIDNNHIPLSAAKIQPKNINEQNNKDKSAVVSFSANPINNNNGDVSY